LINPASLAVAAALSYKFTTPTPTAVQLTAIIARPIAVRTGCFALRTVGHEDF
jgi:hypothetical protein